MLKYKKKVEEDEFCDKPHSLDFIIEKANKILQRVEKKPPKKKLNEIFIMKVKSVKTH